MILVNVKLDVSGDMRITFQKTSLTLFITNGTAKIKLVILSFLCCGEFMKNSNEEKTASIEITG